MEKVKEFKFLNVGYTSFPLKDVNKKFDVVDTIEIRLKKPGLIDLKIDKYNELFMNHRDIEKAIWEEIRKEHKDIEADWLVISMISEYGDELSISLDILKEKGIITGKDIEKMEEIYDS